MTGLDRYAECANETSQCVESCRAHNPTAGDVHGIIEVESLEPSAGAQVPESTQAEATAALRARLERQRGELSDLEQQVAARHQEAVAAQSSISSTDRCRPKK